MWRPEDPQGNETGKIKYLTVPYTRGIGADVGCGPHKGFKHWIGIDNCIDTQLFGIQMQPDLKVETCEVLPFEDGELDFVYSSHTLEHIADYKRALAEWWRVIKVGGHLVLYLPHADLYPRIGQPGANPDHKHDFVNQDIVDAMREVGSWDLLVDEIRPDGTEYSFYQVYRKTDAADCGFPCDRPRPAKTACIVRYGGYGDQIQSANLLPELKRRGYHVTFMTTPKGQEILAHDPHIDEWIIQDVDQVPNQELFRYWQAWQKRFDKWINLSESVEGTLLAMPGRANHQWSHEMRHKHLNHNYGEFMADIAGIAYKSDARFYESPEELGWVRQYKAERFGDDFAIMWALAGSSMHKFYPWQDAVIARVLLEIPRARFVLVGDDACRLLEQGWEQEPRVILESGNLSIRKTLALANAMDCVVGPETGVLNSVGFLKGTGKVCLLSHSSTNNLTKHWKNTIPIVPDSEIKCYPCHRLHYGSEFCHEHPESGAAMCQASIDPERVFEAIRKLYRVWEQHEARRTA